MTRGPASLDCTGRSLLDTRRRSLVPQPGRNGTHYLLIAGLLAEKYDRSRVFLELFPGSHGSLSITFRVFRQLTLVTDVRAGEFGLLRTESLARGLL